MYKRSQKWTNQLGWLKGRRRAWNSIMDRLMGSRKGFQRAAQQLQKLNKIEFINCVLLWLINLRISQLFHGIGRFLFHLDLINYVSGKIGFNFHTREVNLFNLVNYLISITNYTKLYHIKSFSKIILTLIITSASTHYQFLFMWGILPVVPFKALSIINHKLTRCPLQWSSHASARKYSCF